MTNSISVISLLIYVIVLCLIGIRITRQTYHKWGLPFPHRFLGTNRTDQRWKLDWGSTMFLWSVMGRNLWVLKLVYLKGGHVDLILTSFYLVDALTGIIFYYYIQREGVKRNEFNK